MFWFFGQNIALNNHRDFLSENKNLFDVTGLGS